MAPLIVACFHKGRQRSFGEGARRHALVSQECLWVPFFVGVVRMSMHRIHAVLEQEGYVVIEAANSYEGLLAAAALAPSGRRAEDQVSGRLLRGAQPA